MVWGRSDFSSYSRLGREESCRVFSSLGRPRSLQDLAALVLNVPTSLMVISFRCNTDTSTSSDLHVVNVEAAI